MVEAFGDGRVIVFGTEFFWYEPGDADPLTLLRFTGYSDYDLLTAVQVDRTATCLDEPDSASNEEYVVPGPERPNNLFDDLLQRLAADKVNLLRVWGPGKHNARDWRRSGANPLGAEQVRNEHDLPPFAADNPENLHYHYNLTGPFLQDYLDRLTELCEQAKQHDMIVMITLFDNITLRKNGKKPNGNPEDRFNWGTSPWFWGNQDPQTLSTVLPENGHTDDNADAFPNWYAVCADDPNTPQQEQCPPGFFDPLLLAQLDYIEKMMAAVAPYGNVIFELMNEPAPDPQSFVQIAIWHELAAFIIHTIDPTRIVVFQPTMQPDICENPSGANDYCRNFLPNEGGTFRLGVECIYPPELVEKACGHDRETGLNCEECVGDDDSPSVHGLMDLPDFDAISLHYGQWGRPYTSAQGDTWTTQKMDKVLSRATAIAGHPRLFEANRKPVIADTDAAREIDPSVQCNDPCGDNRIGANNARLAVWANRAIDRGASFNHKDGIGTTDLDNSSFKCSEGDATSLLTAANLESQSRLDDQALLKLNLAEDRILGSVPHFPDYAGIDIRCDGEQLCVAEFGDPDYTVTVRGSVAWMGAAMNTFKIQYRWLVLVGSNEQVLAPAGSWTNLPAGGNYDGSYILDQPNGYYRVDHEWITGPLDENLRGHQLVGLEMCITDTGSDCNSGGAYDRDAVLVLNASNSPFDAVTNGFDPTILADILFTSDQGFLPVIDDGSLRATISGSTATLSWFLADPDLDATVSVSFGDDPTGGETAATGLTSNSVQVGGLEAGQTYYWRIAAADPDMHVDESLIQSFTVPAVPPNTVILEEPLAGAPVPPTTSLIWHVENAESGLTYSVFMDLCPGGTCGEPTTPVDGCQQTTATTCDPTPGAGSGCTPDQLAPNAQYRYRVVANSQSVPPTSASATFLTGGAVNNHLFYLHFPSPNEENVEWEDTEFFWSAPCDDDANTSLCTKEPSQYMWRCRYIGELFNCGPVPYCRTWYTDLQTDTIYTWAVFTSEGSQCQPPGCQGAWSEIRSFTTAGPTLTTPTLLLPSNGIPLVVLEGDSIQFSWTSAVVDPPTIPVRYRFDLWRGGVLVASYSNLTATSRVIPASIMAETASYTWQVTATAGSTSQATSVFTLPLTHTDKWVVMTPGLGAGPFYAHRASIYYQPNPTQPSNMQPIRQINVTGETSVELLPAVGELASTWPGEELVFGSGISGSNKVHVYGRSLMNFVSITSFAAFTADENLSKRIHVAIGDVDSSNPGNEIIVGTGSKYFYDGTLPGTNRVKIFKLEGITATLLSSFTPSFGPNPSGEVWVAAGDLLPDPGDEIVCGPGHMGSRVALIYNGQGTLLGGVGTPQMSPGPFDVSVAVGDFSPTNAGNEILASGLYGANDVRLYSQGGTELGAYQVFTSGQNVLGDVNVAAGRIDASDGHEIITGTGPKGNGYLQIKRSNNNTIVLQQIALPSQGGGEVHVAGNR
jgi:hypothetical protein